MPGDQQSAPVRRAEAWVYVAINPLEDALETEKAYLERGNSTWRFHVRRLEFVRPPDEYLVRDARRILDDLRSVYPRLEEAIVRHAERVKAVEEAARGLHAALLGDEAFVDDVRHKMDEYVKAVGKEPWAGWGPERMVEIAAERIVNQVDSVPPHYFDADFWDRYGKSLREWGERVGYGGLRTAIRECIEDADGLLVELRGVRSEVVALYDVPPADVSGLVPSRG